MCESFQTIYIFHFSPRKLYNGFEAEKICEICTKYKIEITYFGSEIYKVAQFNPKQKIMQLSDNEDISFPGTYITHTIVDIEDFLLEIEKANYKQITLRGINALRLYTAEIREREVRITGAGLDKDGLMAKKDELIRWFDAIDSNKYHRFYKDNLHVKLSKNPTYNYYQRQSLYAYLTARGFECTDTVFQTWFDEPKLSIGVDFKGMKIHYKGFSSNYDTLHISAFFGRMALFDLRLHSPEIALSRTVYYSPRTDKVHVLNCKEKINWSEIQKIGKIIC